MKPLYVLVISASVILTYLYLIPNLTSSIVLSFHVLIALDKRLLIYFLWQYRFIFNCNYKWLIKYYE